MEKYLSWDDYKKTLKVILVYFEKTGIVVFLNYFKRKNLVYASIAGIIRESGF